MTKKEKIIVSAYTGVLMCDFADLQKYAEEKFGRPCFTHEFGDSKFAEELKALSKEEFIELCKPTKTYVPLEKCPCGAKLSVKAKWTIYGHAYKCEKCGLESVPSKTQKNARLYWNYEVKKQLKGENGNGKII